MYKKVINSLLDYIFPQTKEEFGLERLTKELLESKIEPNTYISNFEIIYFFKYKERIIRNAIWAMKYRSKHKIATLFADVMYPFVLEDISDKTIFSNFSEPILIPIPISKKRKRERGYNQAELLVKEILNIDNGVTFSFVENVLVKPNETEHQARTTDRKLREQNIKGTFEVINPEKIIGRNIILIDDVVTTGSTLNEARRMLIKEGARNVCAYVVAH